MCGITGYIGHRAASGVLLGALQKLEYRGYDSAGIAVFDGSAIDVRKMKGPLSALSGALAGREPSGSLGIGHTRWATHGEPSDINSHPHTDVSGRIAVVHNGIIENYAKLKSFLRERGVVFKSETDTEVIAHLINYYYQKDAHTSAPADSLLRATLRAVGRLEGSFALGVIASDYPDRLIAARRDSPLIVGAGKNENLIASDAPALLAYTRDVYYLADNELAVLYNDHIDIYNDAGEKIIRSVERIDWDIAAAEKTGFAHFMLKEIYEQPKALRDTLTPRIVAEAGGTPAIVFDEFNLESAAASAKRIVIAACGTAYHAGVIGKYAFERFARLPVEVDIASEYRYRNPVFDKDDLFLIISQSGETADTLAALRLARERGAHVIAITNAVGSTMSREAGIVLYTRAGPEIAVASTKAFTTQLMCIYLLALRLGRARGTLDAGTYLRGIEQLRFIAESGADAVLQNKETVQRFASRHFNKKNVFFLGRQFDFAVSLESALKLKEISYTHSEAFAAGELKHGPIALVDKDTLVVTFATQPELYDKITSNIREVTSRGAASLVITSSAGAERFTAVADEIWTIPAACDAEYTPLVSVIYAQLFAYYCSVERGNDPDKPRNLAKSVTVE